MFMPTGRVLLKVHATELATGKEFGYLGRLDKIGIEI